MADQVKQVLACLLLLFGPYAYAKPPSKCTLTVGKAKYSITNWTWKIVVDKLQKAYYINVCGKVDHHNCNEKSDDWSVCSTTTDDLRPKNMGSQHPKLLKSEDGTGFIMNYTGGPCPDMGNNKNWETNIFMRCGKVLGSPQFVDVSVGSSKCVAIFEFVTNEACSKPPAVPEIPCSLYDNDNKLRDLTPLIKLKGGYEVSSAISNFDFHINVCRGITAEKAGHTQGCPANSSMCRVDTKLQVTKDLGNINYASKLSYDTQDDAIRLVYNTTEKVDNCLPLTTITFKCSKQMGVKGPVLTAARDCAYEVLWETVFACPQSSVMSTNSCVLINEFVNFDLTKLTAAKLTNYKVYQDVEENHKTTHYIYYINVCKPLGYPCGGTNSTATVCQENQDGKMRRSLGDITRQTLRYADGQLTLTYEHGTPCSNGLRRTTIFMFICDYHAGKGHPVFNSESYCFYYFDWRTEYACPPSRRTGTACRVEGPSGLRYDLSELVRMDNASNWIALDGESSSSDKQIFINVCGQLMPHQETNQCDRASAICMKEKEKVTSLGKYTDPPTLNQDNSIKLVYTQGSECKKDNQGKIITINSTITFVCQPGDLESPPVLVTHTQDNCHYQFMWKTAAACSLGLNTGDDCKVEDKDAGYVFDLTPLARQMWDKNDFYTVQSSSSQYKFQLKVCGGSNNTACVGSNIPSCQVKKDNPKQNWTLGLPNSKLYYYDGMLNLTYVNGTKCHNGISRTTHITFLCNSTAVNNGIGVPEYEKENHCVYNFRWYTKYACPAKITECIARSDTRQYDLTSLVKTKDNWQAQSDGGMYYINVCRSLNLGPSVTGCSGTAAVCLKKDNGKTFNLGAVANAPRFEGKNIVITYTNGDKCPDDKDKHYETKITFICKTGLTSSSPKFVETVGCTFKFEWETAAACAIKNVVGKNCQVKDPKSDTTFNLLPLYKRKNPMYSSDLTDNKEQGKLELNICGPVTACGQGRDDVGACLTTNDGKKIALGKANKELEYKGEIVTLVYREGDNYEETGQQREVHIKFYCNPKTPFGTPTFTGQEGNKYFFDFQTSLVCSASSVQCAVSGNGKFYDLTPMGLTNSNWEAVDTRTQDKHLHYFINICRAVNPTPELMKCPGGAIGACQIDHSSNKGFNLGYVQSNPQVAANGELSLQYSGGSECHHQFNRSIRIVFSCSKIMGSPIFLAESPECEYLFSWQTPSACPLKVEHGTNCTVEDTQYGFMFNLSQLYNKDKDYNVSVRGAPGVRIILNVCNKLVSTPKGCSTGKNVGACILDAKSVSVVPDNRLTYFNGRINMTYGKSPSVNFIFECNQGTTGRDTGPTCEKKKDKSYECHWQTAYACRPMISVQCSIRNEDGSVDEQYDFSLLSKSDRNWRARITGPNMEGVAYFINVCRTVILPKRRPARRCPPTAGVCMVKGGKYYNLGTIKHGPKKENNNIYLTYEDGGDCGNGKNYSTRIQMECGSTEGEPLYVTMSKQTCVYEFLWITSTACPINTTNEVVFDNCTAINPQTKVLFDLNPLGKMDYSVLDKQGHNYTLHVCGALKTPPKGCDPKSGVCQQVGQQMINAGKANSRLHFDDGVLYLNLSGGDQCHHVKKNRETIIQFVCSSSGDLGKPVFISENDCTYYIVWHTSLACERQFECAASKQVGEGSKISTIKYSLGRLSRTDANWLVMSEDASKDSYEYYVNLCRPLLPMPGINCPAGAWACGVAKKADEHSGKHDVKNLGRAKDPPIVDDSGQVRLVYSSSTLCEDKKANMTVHFTFTCAYGSLGHPILDSGSSDKCDINIRWATSAACPDTQTAELDKCRVYDNGTGEYYSLKSLASFSKDTSYYTVGSTSDPYYFYVSVCGELKLSQDNCKGAGVCLVTKHGDKNMYKPLGLYKNRAMTYYKDEEMLILKYCNAECGSKEAVTVSRIIFVCDRSQRGKGQPTLDTYGNYGADFAWRTSLVCPPKERECSYTDGSSNYNLQLLTSRTQSWHYEHNKDRFWINICRGISDGPAGCPPTASVCMIRAGSKKVNIIGLTSTQMMSKNDGKLQLTYSGLPPVEGCDKGSNSRVVFYFECGNHVGQPQFQSESWSSCSFILNWKSSVACQVEREKIEESGCIVKHPLTGRSIDFNKLVYDSNKRTWNVAGKDESNNDISYYITVCGNLDKDVPCKGSDDAASLCWDGKPYHVKSRTFYYEDSMFSLEMETDESKTVVINFMCSEGEGVGKPKFDYVSSSHHHLFTWPTSIVCADDLSHTVTDIPEAAHKTAKSATKKNVGIAFGVVFAVLLVVVLAVVFYKPSRRHYIISCVRMNFKRHVLRKELKFPVYRYQKLDVCGSDDDEADSLIKEAEGSDDEEENDDDDLLPF
ncbi:hypothetical protein ACROYT_G021424 [Oculina patagonica]